MRTVNKQFAVFAKNLRLQCDKVATIAQICRDTSIHRQQFNKYLAGTSLPNAANLSKICSNLNVDAEALFNVNSAKSSIAYDKTSNSKKRRVHLIESLLLRRGPERIIGNDSEYFNLKPGSYYCYFPFPGMDEYLVRSYVYVWQEQTQLRFARFTRLVNLDEKSCVVFRGRHDGVVVQSSDEVSLIGRNRCLPQQLSFMSLFHNSKLDGFLFGLAITRAASKSIACRIALDYLGDVKPNKLLLKSTGFVDITDNAVPDQIRAALASVQLQRNSIISSPDRDGLVASMARQLRSGHGFAIVLNFICLKLLSEGFVVGSTT
jgi:transcriptional regulator with XRE-family HTH domain